MAALRYICRKVLINGIKSDTRLTVNYPCGICIRFLNYSPIEYGETL